MKVFSSILILELIAIIITGITLLCIFSPRWRRWLWLLFLSNIPMSILGLFQSFNKSIGRSWLIDGIEIILWSVSIFFLIRLAYRSARKYNIIPPFSWKFFRWGRTILGAFLLIGSQITLSALWQNFVIHNSSNTTTSNQASLNSLALMVPFVIYFLTTVLAGFFEELAFRVGIFEILLPKHKKWAFTVSVILFASVHAPTNIISALIYGTMAIILTSFYFKYRNFYLNMSIHMLLNFVVSGLFFLSNILHLF
ncbi:MAG: CPBP family intramembrane metalloprotease [Streptococcaceae bacterium]|nr:CPBP family intramembrane metalloprotease [Streptococcaceae bacterium]